MPRERIDRLIERLEPRMRRAFEEAIQRIRGRTTIKDVEEALRRGDIDTALRAIPLDESQFEPLRRALRDAFEEGGDLGNNNAAVEFAGAGLQLGVGFDGRNPRAEDWLRQRSSTLITEIIEEQREAVRLALEAGQIAGRNPRQTALDVVGRINRTTGNREGGVIGLTSQQARWVTSAQEELASGDPARLRNYLSRERRDKRYDRRVMKAIREERPLAAADVRQMTRRYSARLLAYRGEVVARTETIHAAHAGQRVGMQQLIDSGRVQSSQVRKIWKATGDGRTRDSHLALHGESVGWDEPFISPATGLPMMHPGDTSMGAAGRDTIQCRCHMETRIDFLGNL